MLKCTQLYGVLSRGVKKVRLFSRVCVEFFSINISTYCKSLIVIVIVKIFLKLSFTVLLFNIV